MTDATTMVCVFCGVTRRQKDMVEVPGSKGYDGEPRFVCNKAVAECSRRAREKRARERTAKP